MGDSGWGLGLCRARRYSAVSRHPGEPGAGVRRDGRGRCAAAASTASGRRPGCGANWQPPRILRKHSTPCARGPKPRFATIPTMARPGPDPDRTRAAGSNRDRAGPDRAQRSRSAVASHSAASWLVARGLVCLCAAVRAGPSPRRPGPVARRRRARGTGPVGPDRAPPHAMAGQGRGSTALTRLRRSRAASSPCRCTRGDARR